MKTISGGSSPRCRADRRRSLPAAAVLAAGVAAIYGGSLGVPFIYDDHASIADNPTIRALGTAFSPPALSGVGGRPLLNLSFALSYAAGKGSLTGQHLANVCIHFAAACVLFGLIRRTLRLPRLADRFGGDASWLALIISALWAWHPVQTQSVTYLSQRAESLMGLFYLLTMYAFVRWAASCSLRCSRPDACDRANPTPPGLSPWAALSIGGCALGMAVKETMVTAPIAVFLYDRTFVAGSFREAWRRRRAYYCALAAAWVPLGLLLSGVRARGVGFGGDVGAWSYGLEETRAILRYLRLAVWPHPLVFDYGAQGFPGLHEAWPDLAAVVLLLVLCAIALRRRPGLGFALAWFFLILAPTSSVIPIAGQPIAENRLYLPLAAVVALAVLGAHAWMGRRSWPGWIGAAMVLAAMATARNRAYASEVSLWQDTVDKCPDNARARNNLGQALLARRGPGDVPAAAAALAAALQLAPGISKAAEIHNDLGNALGEEDKADEAEVHYRAAIALEPDFAEAHYNLGNLLGRKGRPAEAAAQFEAAIRARPGYAQAHNNLGNALHSLGRGADAVREIEEALRLDPTLAEAHFNLGCARMAAGRNAEAVMEFQTTLRLNPRFAAAQAMLRRLEGSAP